MKTIRLLLFAAFITPIAASAQVDTEPGNSTCAELFPIDTVTLDVPNQAGMSSNGDEDIFLVEVPNGGLLEASVVPLENGAAFKVTILGNNCQPIAPEATGSPGGPAHVVAVVCPGTYNVRVRQAPGLAVGYTLTVTTNNGDSLMECNNTFETATLIPTDTVFPARLWGQNTELTNGQPSGFDYNADQDFFKVFPDSSGILTVEASGVPGNLELIVTVYDHLMQPVAGNGNNGDGVTITHNVMLCTSSPFYYIRINDYYEPIYNPYENSETPFQLSFSFNPEESCECNNTFETACEVPTNTTLMTRLFGSNTVLTNGQPSGFDYNPDQDFYRVVPPSSGVLTVSATGIPDNLELIITVYDHLYQPVAGNGNLGNVATVTHNVLMCTSPYYYVRVSDYYEPIYNPYENSPTAFQLEFSFDTEDSCECNNIFTTACEQQVGEPFAFKIFGKNNSNYYTPNDRDFFMFTPDECGTMNLSVVNIPPGFSIRARLYSDTTDITTPLGQSPVATGPATLSWDMPVVAGQPYYLELREDGDNAMDSQLMTATIGITPSVIPPPTVTVTGSTELCPGETVTLTSSEATGNFWSNGDTTQSILVDEAGIYTVTAYDGQGCPATSTPPVTVSVQPGTQADFTVGTISGGEVEFTNSSSNADSYLWLFGDGSSVTTTSPTHIYSENGEYEVTLIAIGACGQDTIMQVVSITSVGIEVHQIASFALWPNPTNGTINLELSGKPSARTANITTTLGQPILTLPLNGSQRQTINLTPYENGVYFVEVRYADGTRAVERIVKQ